MYSCASLLPPPSHQGIIIAFEIIFYYLLFRITLSEICHVCCLIFIFEVFTDQLLGPFS